jgi:hypothetical protein
VASSVTSASEEGALDDALLLEDPEALAGAEELAEPEPLPELEPLDELSEPTSRTEAPSSPHEAATRANAKTSPSDLSIGERFMCGFSIKMIEGG